MNPPNIKAYKVVSSHDPGELEEAVNKLIAKGWQPLGSVQVVCPLVNQSPAPAFYQAMVSGGRSPSSVPMAWEELCAPEPDSAAPSPAPPPAH